MFPADKLFVASSKHPPKTMLVYFTIALIVLLAFCGLAVDIGRIELRTNQLQAAVDAAAIAAAAEQMHGGTNSNWQTAANNDAAAIEAANGIQSVGSPVLQLSAAYGPYVGDYSTVQATITQSVPTLFLSLLGHATSAMTVTVNAVAQMPPCMIFFGNPNIYGTYAFWVSSSAVDTQVSWGCPLYTKTGTVIDYFSHYYGSQTRSSAPASSSSYGSTWTAPVYNVPVIQDPLAYITAPSAGNCANSSPISSLNQSTGTTISFTPGTYCGKTTSNPTYSPGPTNCGQPYSTTTPAIDVEGTYNSGCPYQGSNGNLTYTNGGNCKSNPTVNFAPGLYIFIGGVNFTCVTVIGNGVTMYFTRSGSVGYGQMRMTGTTWNVNAPNDASNGGIPGISVMNDRNWSGSVDDFQWNYSSWLADGVVYLTGTGIYDFNTPMYCPNYLNIVAANMYNYFGSLKPGVNYASLSGGNPLHTAVSLVQ